MIGAAGVRTTTVMPRITRRFFDAAISVAKDRASFDALETDWRELDRTAEGATIFQSFAWCRAVFDHHMRCGEEFSPLVVTLYEAGRLIGLLPLQLTQSGVARIATGFGEPYQQYSDVLVAPDAPAGTALRLLAAARRLPGIDGISLLKVRDDSALAPLLTAKGAIRSNEDAAPFVDLRPYGDFDAYLATINAKTRKNMRNTKNRLARKGVLGHKVITEPSEIAELVERAHVGRERWLGEQGLTSRAFRDPTFADFATSVVSGKNPLPVLAMSLTLDGVPIADQWGFVHNGRYYAYLATWMPEHEAASPGKLHLEEVIRACHERGLAIADFLMPAARYKFTWTDQAVALADYSLPVSFRARLQLWVWSGWLRPLLKRVALKLPAGIRSQIAKLLLR